MKQNKMNQKELVNAIAKESGLTKRDTRIFLRAFTQVIENTLREGKRITIIKFGSFFPKVAKEKIVRSRYTNRAMTVPEHINYKFRFSEYFTEKIKKDKEE